jgi:hypothetical protein
LAAAGVRVDMQKDRAAAQQLKGRAVAQPQKVRTVVWS